MKIPGDSNIFQEGSKRLQEDTTRFQDIPRGSKRFREDTEKIPRDTKRFQETPQD